MSQVNQEYKYNSLESLLSYLSVIKTLHKEDLDDEYFELMEGAKKLLGDVNPKMARFYYEYGSYLLDRIQKNGEIFGSFKPTKQQKQAKIPEIQQEDEGEDEDDGEKVDQVRQPTKPAHNVCFKAQGVVIEDDNEPELKPAPDNSATKQPNDTTANITGAQQPPADQGEPEEEQDDEEICFENLFASFNIYNGLYEAYLNGEQDLTQEEANTLMEDLARVRCRLGDYHSIRENIDQAVQEFTEAGELLSRLPNGQSKSALASIELSIGNAYLYQGKPGCEEQAMPHFMKAVKLLVNRLVVLTGTNSFPLPDYNNAVVERLLYLPRWDDSQQIKRQKGIICQVLDKIEDTEIQRKQFKELQKIKDQQKQEQNVENSFTPLPQNTNVVNLGTFGNANSLIRRKVPAEQVKQAEVKSDIDHEPKRFKELYDKIYMIEFYVITNINIIKHAINAQTFHYYRQDQMCYLRILELQ